MSLRFQSQLLIDSIPDPQLDNAFEVVMPTLRLDHNGLTKAGFLNSLAGYDYTPMVENISFGTMSFGSEARRVRTGWINVPNDINNYEEVKIEMYCSVGMLTQYYLETWKNLVFNQDGEYYNQANFYKRNIEVYFYGVGNVGQGLPLAAHYTLVGCFPTKQSPYKLRYSSSPKRLVLTQSFKMDKILFDMSLYKSSMITELVSAPLAVGERALVAAEGGTSKYILNNTY